MLLTNTYEEFVKSRPKEFPSQMTHINKCFLVVGERTGKAGNFRISYVCYPPMYGGHVRFHFSYQTEKFGHFASICAPKSFPSPLSIDDSFVPITEKDYTMEENTSN